MTITKQINKHELQELGFLNQTLKANNAMYSKKDNGTNYVYKIEVSRSDFNNWFEKFEA